MFSEGFTMASQHNPVALSKLASLGEKDCNAVLGSIARAAQAPRNGQATQINARIAAYEAQFKIASSEIGKALASGELKEDEDVAQWLMLLAVVRRSATR
jgi:hypothetical protein